MILYYYIYIFTYKLMLSHLFCRRSKSRSLNRYSKPSQTKTLRTWKRFIAKQFISFLQPLLLGLMKTLQW